MNSIKDKTIGERFNLIKFDVEQPTSLMIRFDRILDMKEDELSDGDIAFCLRQRMILDFSIPKALQMLKENPNIGEGYDAELLFSLADVFPFPGHLKEEARSILPLLREYAELGEFELEKERGEFRQLVNSLAAVLDTPWESSDNRSLQERFGLQKDERPCEPETGWLYNDVIERNEGELTDKMMLCLLERKMIPSVSVKKAIVRLRHDPSGGIYAGGDYLRFLSFWRPFPKQYLNEMQALIDDLSKYAEDGYFATSKDKDRYQKWLASLEKCLRDS